MSLGSVSSVRFSYNVQINLCFFFFLSCYFSDLFVSSCGQLYRECLRRAKFLGKKVRFFELIASLSFQCELALLAQALCSFQWECVWYDCHSCFWYDNVWIKDFHFSTLELNQSFSGC